MADDIGEIDDMEDWLKELSHIAQQCGFEAAVLGSGADLMERRKSVTLLHTDKTDPGGNRRARRGVTFPTAEVDRLTIQLRENPSSLEDFYGYVNDAGVVEVLVILEPIVGGSGIYRQHSVLRAGSNLSSPPLKCRHVASPMHSADLSKYWPQIKGIYDFTSQHLEKRSKTFHLSDPGRSDICLEISHASPCGVAFGPSRVSSLIRGLVRSWPASLKIDTGCSLDKDMATATALNLIGSFAYELAVRNGIHMEPKRRIRAENNDILRMVTNSCTDLRYPKTVLNEEVAELFSFASSAWGNPPLAFLSYYQILEYYFPHAVRRMTIRDVRRELADPRFGETDADILRIIGVAERSARATEGEQIGELVRTAVKEDRLNEFLKDPAHGRYFTKNGPISGVDPINLVNPNRSVQDQVASRVYKLRNRIVHSKDDPKYAVEARVLLPRSREALALGPDVALVKLLAEEVITDSQVRL
ncbi:hypothetical protein [Nocardia sp. NPDC019255]|uniref:hypothetical protein n=1 Tax=Nocardia sp. NPDC019255 TaxID=3154591 RepID=UPI0033CC7C50